MKDYYFILGVARNADNHEIKEAFRKLSLKYHPDRTVPTSYNHERYMEICEAYRVLSNKEKRQRYDNASPEATGIIPEIQTSYKGYYPWFALFAVIIVAGICTLFITRQNGYQKTSNTTPVKETTLPQPIPKRQPKSIVIIDSAPDTIATKTISVNKDTVLVKPAPVAVATDTLTKTQSFIASALDKHTVEPNRKKHPTSERNFQYSFRGEKLFVTYEQPDMKGKIVRKQVAIPVKKIESVYVYAGQLWITSPQKAIQVINLKNGQQEKTDFFSVRFNAGSTPNVEQEIAQAFASLKTEH
jgi:hypothetical protein